MEWKKKHHPIWCPRGICCFDPSSLSISSFLQHWCQLFLCQLSVRMRDLILGRYALDVYKYGWYIYIYMTWLLEEHEFSDVFFSWLGTQEMVMGRSTSIRTRNWNSIPSNRIPNILTVSCYMILHIRDSIFGFWNIGQYVEPWHLVGWSWIPIVDMIQDSRMGMVEL